MSNIKLFRLAAGQATGKSHGGCNVAGMGL
jgi:hypothetical protein